LAALPVSGATSGGWRGTSRVVPLVTPLGLVDRKHTVSGVMLVPGA
jgi:hypothetical protein